jgi:Fe2+ transport system protein FeoA
MQQDSVICQVCNARVALSQELAEAILVETVS